MQAKRKLGRTDIAITPLMLGGNVFGWTADEKASFAVLDAFVDAGGDAIDSADVYSAWVPGHQGGESESVIGRWLKASGKRGKVVIGTKVGMWPKQLGIKRDNILAPRDAPLNR
ncbi:MAG: aldo/keto reductase, partial [Proteobacteria bacterium]|nr:aldo/keto reductase [Pseudomonadota bacterium]